MASGEQSAAIGLKISGQLHSSDASANVKIPLRRQDTNALVTVGSAERLAVTLASIVTVVSGDSAIFFDFEDLASAEAITAIVDGGGGEDTVTISGNRLDEFGAGRIFVIANSTANDGTYTSTGAAYDSSTDATTINVATASWTDTTVDGDITSNPLNRDGSVVERGTYVASGGEVNIMPGDHDRIGRVGEAVYAVAVAGVVDAKVFGFIRKVITKSGPVGNPIHDPT